MARAANIDGQWASMASRWWWNTGLAFRSLLGHPE